MVNPVTGGQKRLEVAAASKGKSCDTRMSKGDKGTTKVAVKKKPMAKVKKK